MSSIYNNVNFALFYNLAGWAIYRQERASSTNEGGAWKYVIDVHQLIYRLRFFFLFFFFLFVPQWRVLQQERPRVFLDSRSLYNTSGTYRPRWSQKMTVPPWKGSQLNLKKKQTKQQFNSRYSESKAKRLHIYYNKLAGNTALEIFIIIIFFFFWFDFILIEKMKKKQRPQTALVSLPWRSLYRWFIYSSLPPPLLSPIVFACWSGGWGGGRSEMKCRQRKKKVKKRRRKERDESITYLYLQVPRGQFAGRVYRRRPPDPTPSEPPYIV